MSKKFTLISVVKNEQILLGMKKRGFGLGRYTLLGGKVEEGETIEEGAQREAFEESNLELKDLRQIATINFSWQNKKNPDMEVYLFRANDFSGTLEENDEIKPEWFEIKNIPYKKMWEDNTYWLPYFLKNKNFKADFILGDNDKVISHQITEI